ncbi:DUF6773 family protein [Desulfitobacterium metallireducens]|uniref:Membrane protein n=1 Tax=Desulfitobacterium metallireducens DSM 15288 TaxID=871968 RepID=W0E626_9FIRM|nr:DUF6773 family protein [Desulfitobacterium metallireducens]AHF06315.1 membrane protein [Desulfitobacterium metallireducens DSM 15288]
MNDERVEQAKNKIWSELAIIIFCGVALSFLVKTLVFNMNLTECITEYLILIFSPLYQFIRMHMMKISIYSTHVNRQSLKNLIIAIVIVLVASAVSIFKKMKESAVYDWQRPAVFLFIFLVSFISLSFITNKYNRNRGHEYEKEFDDDI